jgi:3-oxoacyl-[acyl-carrier protein] reductase
MTLRLENSFAIVTGGANGIGRAITKRFITEGAHVAVWDLDTEAAQALEAELDHKYYRFQPVDVTNPESVEKAAAECASDWGRIDILINNAGILHDAQLVKYKDGAMIESMSLKTFDDVIDVNLRGTFLCTRAVVPYMIKHEFGRVINTTSIVGIYGNFGQTNYAASKSGVIGMTRVWSRELGRYKITVNAVAPGFIETEMVRHMPEKILQMMIERTPLKRLGKPDEIANVFLFLASAEASFITGSVVSADGGTVLGT